jgi:hypothetical protein
MSTHCLPAIAASATAGRANWELPVEFILPRRTRNSRRAKLFSFVFFVPFVVKNSNEF